MLFADDSIVFLEATNDSMTTLGDILQRYEEASGQKVNLEKNPVFFGPCIQDNYKNEVQQILGVSVEALSERYLGLPTVVE